MSERSDQMQSTERVADPSVMGGTPKQQKRKAVATGQRDFTPTQTAIISIVSLALFFVAWTVVKEVYDVPRLFMPGLEEIWAALRSSYEAGRLVPHTMISARLFLWSILLSLAIAIPLGIIVGAVEVLNRTFSTWFWAIYTSPQIVFLPLILLWFGISTTAKVVLIVISAVPPATVIIIEGVKTVDASIIRASRSYGASRSQTLRKVVIPGTMPYIGTGVRMGVSRGLVGLFAAELFTAQEGLGFLLMDASRRYNTPMVFGVLAIYLVFCMAAIAGSNSLEKRLSRWKE